MAESIDWVKRGAVTPVKNQERCGSCWAFSSTGALEGAHFIAHKELLSLSEQQLVDCSKANNGCNGGLMDYAFTYAEDQLLEVEQDYPYRAVDDECNYDVAKGKVKASGVRDVAPNDPQQLKAALNLGPVSVAIQADSKIFQNYVDGVINTDECGTTIDHGVLAVGYGKEGAQEYVLVKNSWGPQWGANGYVKIALTDGKGICGIN